MSVPTKVKVRYSLYELQEFYNSGNQQPLNDLLNAWIGIKLLLPPDLNSFFILGGYHAEPFEGQGQSDPKYWGGYCNHGNVLFPTWHRMYMLRVEQALQSIVPGVMMPYWDETSDESMQKGIPTILTDEQVLLNGVMVDNPLRSYKLAGPVFDGVKGDGNLYTKPKGYETVRYPLSGLVSTATAIQKTKKHNNQYTNPVQNTVLLNKNVRAWLNSGTPEPGDTPLPPAKTGVAYAFYRCLDAPNYTTFSNTTSSAAWSKLNPGPSVVALETPHNDIHLSVGGFDFGGDESGLIAGANGDMGENNTAGFDPIFYFHHCNIDRMFWLWQIKHNKTNNFDIIPHYPGTNASGKGQGPAVGQQKNEELTMDSPLFPFLMDPAAPASLYTSRDCINIETQLGFTYSDGSLAGDAVLAGLRSTAALSAKTLDESDEQPCRKLEASGINRSLFRGSFVIRAYAQIDTKRHYLGHHSVLSRGNVANCTNCQTHLDISAYFDLDGFSGNDIQNATFSIEIHHRGHDGKDLPKALNYTLKVID